MERISRARARAKRRSVFYDITFANQRPYYASALYMRHNKVAKSIGEMSELGYVDVCVADHVLKINWLIFNQT